jgi:hypothetical protein
MRILLLLLISMSVTAKAEVAVDSTKIPWGIWGNIKSIHILYNQKLNPYVYYPRISNQTYAQVFFQKGQFSGGFRVEGYLEPQVGMPKEMEGWGLASKYLKYQNKKLEIGLGNHYEQFGSGLVLKTQEQRAIGMDNSLDGLWVNFTLGKLHLKSLSGKQRVGFGHAKGWISGIDMEIRQPLKNNSIFSVGLSNVLNSERVEHTAKKKHEFVNAASLRAGLVSKQISVQVEYAAKSLEAIEFSDLSLKEGNALVGNLEWNHAKNAAILQFKRVINMDFRSEKGTILNTAVINYVPNFTKFNTYRLLTLYPYAAQVKGEIGGQLDWTFMAENGGELNANLSVYHQPRYIRQSMPLYKEISLEYSKSLNQNTKLQVLANYAQFNKGIVLGGFSEIVKYQALVADLTFKVSKNLSINTQAQHLYTRQDKGSWALALLDFRIKSKWSVFLMDEFNYSKRDHYYQAGSKLQLGNKYVGLSYGKVREGLFCVGGVCQIIPEYEGLSVNFGVNF